VSGKGIGIAAQNRWGDAGKHRGRQIGMRGGGQSVGRKKKKMQAPVAKGACAGGSAILKDECRDGARCGMDIWG